VLAALGLQELVDGGGEGFIITGWNEHAGLALQNRIGNSSHVGGNHRSTGRHRFDDKVREAFLPGCEDGDVEDAGKPGSCAMRPGISTRRERPLSETCAARSIPFRTIANQHELQAGPRRREASGRHGPASRGP
jgi:hypothetical protein